MGDIFFYPLFFYRKSFFPFCFFVNFGTQSRSLTVRCFGNWPAMSNLWKFFAVLSRLSSVFLALFPWFRGFFECCDHFLVPISSFGARLVHKSADIRHEEYSKNNRMTLVLFGEFGCNAKNGARKNRREAVRGKARKRLHQASLSPVLASPFLRYVPTNWTSGRS